MVKNIHMYMDYDMIIKIYISTGYKYVNIDLTPADSLDFRTWYER